MDLSLKGINFGKPVTPIQFTETILHSRKVVFFNKNDVWLIENYPDIDVKMAVYMELRYAS